jgi:hypothetical protein
MKKTAVQILSQFMEEHCNPSVCDIEYSDFKQAIREALEMEKQQMLEFWNGGIDCTEERGKSFEQYYKETHEQKEE